MPDVEQAVNVRVLEHLTVCNDRSSFDKGAHVMQHVFLDSAAITLV